MTKPSRRMRALMCAGVAACGLMGGGAEALALGPKSGQPPVAQEGSGPVQGPDSLLEKVGITQKLGEQLPMDLRFTDSTGKTQRLGDLMGDRPVVLAMVYYECPMLCTMVLNGMLRVLNVLKFDVGKELDVITVSIDPRETPELAADKKKMYIDRYRREGAAEGWHFLVGEESQVASLADAIGFEYAYDEETDQYAHGSAIMVLTPDGKLSKYLYGIDYSPVDLRLALVEAASERIGTLSDAVLLACFQYDPLEGKYSLAIMNLIRIAGLVTVLGIGIFIVINLLRERRRTGASRLGPEGREAQV